MYLATIFCILAHSPLLNVDYFSSAMPFQTIFVNHKPQLRALILMLTSHFKMSDSALNTKPQIVDVFVIL